MSQQSINNINSNFELDLLKQPLIFRKKLVEKILNPLQEGNNIQTCTVKCLEKNCK